MPRSGERVTHSKKSSARYAPHAWRDSSYRSGHQPKCGPGAICGHTTIAQHYRNYTQLCYIGKAQPSQESLTKPNEQQKTVTELLQEISNLHSSQKEPFPSYQDLIRDESFSTHREHDIQNAHERSVKLAPKLFDIITSISISNKLRKTVTSTKFKTAWGLINKGEILDSSIDADRLYRF